MSDEFTPILRQRLSDSLASRLGAMIQTGSLAAGERLPAIAEMARAFRVGAPTLRQALTKLETMGLIDIRHGQGVYVLDARCWLLDAGRGVSDLASSI